MTSIFGFLFLNQQRRASPSTESYFENQPSPSSLTPQRQVSVVCPNTSIGWRYLFIDKENKAFAHNTKDYIASAIDMDFHIEIDPDPRPFPCLLNRTDRTSTMGWLCK